MRMTVDQITAAILAFEASTASASPTYRRRRTLSVNLSKDPWPKTSVKAQIMAFLTK